MAILVFINCGKWNDAVKLDQYFSSFSSLLPPKETRFDIVFPNCPSYEI